MTVFLLNKTLMHTVAGGVGPVEIVGIAIKTTQAGLDEVIKTSQPEKLPPPFIKNTIDGNKPVTIAPKF